MNESLHREVVNANKKTELNRTEVNSVVSLDDILDLSRKMGEKFKSVQLSIVQQSTVYPLPPLLFLLLKFTVSAFYTHTN